MIRREEIGSATYHDALYSISKYTQGAKNTFKKPAFDATKDITEKDLAQVKYRSLIEDDALFRAQNEGDVKDEWLYAKLYAAGVALLVVVSAILIKML